MNQKKSYFQNISWFQFDVNKFFFFLFDVNKLCMIMCIGIAP